MSEHQTFLVKYGIHNFVSYERNEAAFTFKIKSDQRDSMINHAVRLIKDWYGDQTAIQLV